MSIHVVVPNYEISKFEIQDPYQRCLHEDCVFVVEDHKITVFEGFWWNGASIPRLLWTGVGSPFTGAYVVPTILHDLLYLIQIFDRKKTDDIFYYMNKTCGLSFIKNQTIYRGVRIGGWASYNSVTDIMKESAKKHCKVEKI